MLTRIFAVDAEYEAVFAANLRIKFKPYIYWIIDDYYLYTICALYILVEGTFDKVQVVYKILVLQ